MLNKYNFAYKNTKTKILNLLNENYLLEKQ